MEFKSSFSCVCVFFFFFFFFFGGGGGGGGGVGRLQGNTLFQVHKGTNTSTLPSIQILLFNLAEMGSLILSLSGVNQSRSKSIWSIKKLQQLLNRSRLRENPILLHSNNKGADQSAHPHSLISAFAIHSLESFS